MEKQKDEKERRDSLGRRITRKTTTANGKEATIAKKKKLSQLIKTIDGSMTEWDKDIEAQLRVVVDKMNTVGAYTDGMGLQAKLLAKLMARLCVIEGLMQEGGYSPIVEIETSQSTRIEINPIETLYMKYLSQIQSALKASGLNLDSRSPKGSGEADSFAEFLREMKR